MKGHYRKVPCQSTVIHSSVVPQTFPTTDNLSINMCNSCPRSVFIYEQKYGGIPIFSCLFWGILSFIWVRKNIRAAIQYFLQWNTAFICFWSVSFHL